MSDTNPISDSEVAFSAVQLHHVKPKGNAPSWQEIHDWHSRTLDDARAAEVLSHIAHDPVVFQQWKDISDAEIWLADENGKTNTENLPEENAKNDQTHTADSVSADDNSQSNVVWLSKFKKRLQARPLPALGGAIAAGLLIVLVIPQLQQSDTADLGSTANPLINQYIALGAPLPANAPPIRKTRAMAGVLGNISKPDVHLLQLKRGQLLGFNAISTSPPAQWQPWRGSLPVSAVDCSTASDQAACSASQTPINELGRWSIAQSLLCQSGDALPGASTQNVSIDIANTLLSHQVIANSPLFKSVISQANLATERGVCDLAETLLNADIPPVDGQ